MNYRSILLIDDDEEDHEIFRAAMFRISGELICTTVENARDALHQLVTKQLTPDIIFLDLNMPIMGGKEFLREIKARPGIDHIPVIVYSTSANPNTIRLAKAMGAVDFITKPDRFESLVNVLKTAIS